MADVVAIVADGMAILINEVKMANVIAISGRWNNHCYTCIHIWQMLLPRYVYRITFS